jgi:hypothetical protein
VFEEQCTCTNCSAHCCLLCRFQVYDEKNIRRRVYDALNVLMAMDIISKERKEIRWKGLPSNLQHDTEMLLVGLLWFSHLRLRLL